MILFERCNVSAFNAGRRFVTCAIQSPTARNGAGQPERIRQRNRPINKQ